MIFSQTFKDAAQDYLYLLKRRYSEKTILQAVGDRYQLDKKERALLYRGFDTKDNSALRQAKNVNLVPQSEEIHMDFFNILFTITNYLYGRPVFICTDGFLRDTGEVFGKFHADKTVDQGIDIFLDFLARNNTNIYRIYLDSPVSYSGELAKRLNKELANRDIKGEAMAVKSPDHVLKYAESGLIATSDSVIIEESGCKTWDAAYAILNEKFAPDFTDLRKTAF